MLHDQPCARRGASGKSAVAESIVTGLSPPVTYVATLEVGDDADLAARVARHRARRPAAWHTVEAGRDLAGSVRGLRGTVLVDSLGPWVSSWPGMEVDVDALCDALAERDGDTVVVRRRSVVGASSTGRAPVPGCARLGESTGGGTRRRGAAGRSRPQPSPGRAHRLRAAPSRSSHHSAGRGPPAGGPRLVPRRRGGHRPRRRRVWWSALRVWPPAAAAAVALACDVALTGYLHLDGLADAADGLVPPMPRARRLEVMADPSVGAFGAVTLVAVLILRFAALASAPASPLVVGALWCGSRTAMAVTVRTGTYANPTGMAAAFLTDAGGRVRRAARSRAAVPACTGLALVLVLAIVGGAGTASPRWEPRWSASSPSWRWRDGASAGFTGDVLGAAAWWARRWGCSCWRPSGERMVMNTW